MISSIISPIPLPPVIIVLAFVLDLVAGDPLWMPHPVRWMGRLINLLESFLRRFTHTPSGERFFGAVLVCVTVTMVWAVGVGVLAAALRYSYPLFFILSAYIVYACLSVNSLKTEAAAVTEAASLAEARQRLARIVGRDTADLQPSGVYRAVVETVAENASDGVVAPLFFLAVGGPPLMLAYKAVNTMDSMIGYKNERYLRFGWFAARLDDAANYIPARLTAVLMVIAAFILGYNYRCSLKILISDAGGHPSPNSGWPEAAAAGALGCRLGGPSHYAGEVSRKPYIGCELAEPDEKAAGGVIRLLYLTAVLMVLLVLAGRISVIFLL